MTSVSGAIGPRTSLTVDESGPHNRVLVLWDIDHTLVNSGGVSRDAYAAAFRAVAGRPLRRLADMTGRTDLHIARETFRIHGVEPTPEQTDALLARLVSELNDRVELMAERGAALPGAGEAIKALSQRSSVVQSVLTGNVKANALLKLETFGLSTECLALDVGAYGDDHWDRRALVSVARERARAVYGDGFSGRRTVLIGDTVVDVEAALENGASIVAVATGGTTSKELAGAGAHVVVRDLRDVAALEANVEDLSRS
ncbi:haloacid dehalogenase-like hydrolase [Yinghuangia sp. YIM S10712]|uniref:haloacid dehalogenase-like hydrolase n=1 Tax=Yinghuangia sp. YIM S10712 TaxID=3436930 RepID=UPI003F5371FB